MTPGKMIEGVPVLQCGVSPDQGAAFGTITVGWTKLVFCDTERLAEKSRSQKLQRNFIPVRTNCGTLTEQHRQPPIVFREGGMVMVLVIIHRIKIIPKQRKRYLVVHIHIGA